jgi:metal-responsive CopG/Arc/MetJ family transcriptional regulator
MWEGGNMLIPTKIQIDKKIYEFIRQTHKKLHYRSLSEYMREAVNTKVEEDRKRLREQKRIAAMEMIGRGPHGNLFESIEGEDFENR